MVKLWDFELSPVAEFDVRNLRSPSQSPRIRSVDVSPDGARILVGTQGSEIYEMNTVDGSNMNKDALVQAHFKGQLWGLAVHPNPTNDPELEEFITVGDDSRVRKWDLRTMKLKKLLAMDSPARAVAYKPDGTEICVGLGAGSGKANNRDGAFVIFQPSKDPLKDLAIVHEDRESQEWVRTICYSPDGRRLAIGCEDNQIYIYDTKENWSRTCVLNYHSAPVAALDFTEVGKTGGPGGGVGGWREEWGGGGEWGVGRGEEGGGLGQRCFTVVGRCEVARIPKMTPHSFAPSNTP